MTAATATAVPTVPVDTTAPARSTSLWRSGARAGVLAAVATTGVAAVALAADVPLEVEGARIPLAGFAQLTLVCTAIGVLLAGALRRWAATPRRTFTAATVALTALSLVPDVAVPASTATRIVLAATHLVAAAIVVPALAGDLQQRRARS
jgi:peptidoglycan/LPS O-acetylase OafA/YrhL